MGLNRLKIAFTVFHSDKNHTANCNDGPSVTVFVLFFNCTRLWAPCGHYLGVFHQSSFQRLARKDSPVPAIAPTTKPHQTSEGLIKSATPPRHQRKPALLIEDY